MKSDKDHTVRAALASGFFACMLVGACLCVLLALPGCRKKHTASETPAPAKPSAPDLSGCTRLEFQYLPSTLVFLGTDEAQILLSPEELEYLKSQETFILDDPELIRVLADYVAQTTYFDTSWFGRPRGVPFARVVCYDDERRLTSFTYGYRGFIMAEGEQWFKWPPDVRVDLTRFTPEIRPFVLRIECAYNLWSLRSGLRRFSERNGCYPAPGQWCDALARPRETMEPVAESTWTTFQCPATDRRWSSHYAMNPNCTPDSPENTVLLFETQVSWNQHGGPELFTFDNHDPKGGCVLLNDGTVKFIRTKEELDQLRWE